jgi:hypothetical protein
MPISCNSPKLCYNAATTAPDRELVSLVDSTLRHSISIKIYLRNPSLKGLTMKFHVKSSFAALSMIVGLSLVPTLGLAADSAPVVVAPAPVVKTAHVRKHSGHKASSKHASRKHKHGKKSAKAKLKAKGKKLSRRAKGKKASNQAQTH